MNARSVFYEFLNYWKSIEVVFPDVPGRCSWIDSNVDRLFNERDRIAEIRGANPSVASYLFTDGRCAVAHVNREPIINPDRAGDYERLERDTRIVAGLSKLAIESMDSWMGA